MPALQFLNSLPALVNIDHMCESQSCLITTFNLRKPLVPASYWVVEKTGEERQSHHTLLLLGLVGGIIACNPSASSHTQVYKEKN